MIKHIVLFKLNEFETTTEKQTQKEKIITCLQNLPLQIPEIIEFAVEDNLNNLSNSSDFAIVSDFKSMDTLSIYQQHHAHLEAIKLIRANCLPSSSIDYEY